MPPVLMIAAGRDHVVYLGYERLLRDELQRDGVNVTFVCCRGPTTPSKTSRSASTTASPSGISVASWIRGSRRRRPKAQVQMAMPRRRDVL